MHCVPLSEEEPELLSSAVSDMLVECDGAAEELAGCSMKGSSVMSLGVTGPLDRFSHFTSSASSRSAAICSRVRRQRLILSGPRLRMALRVRMVSDSMGSGRAGQGEQVA